MLSRFVVLILAACVTTGFARPVESELIGKWLWHGIDAEAVLTFQPDHTYIIERTGFEHHDLSKATWQLSKQRLTVSWPDGQKDAYTIVKLTSATLILHSDAAGREHFRRIK